MNKYEKVEGVNYMVRDPHSQAILSTDHDAFEIARQAKKLRKEKLEQQDQMKNDIEGLKQDMKEIKTLLLAMGGKNG
tara:strand:+ start:708 stop:938 length:231 start_codon:yes stop_codon:yes gene_type:complete